LGAATRRSLRKEEKNSLLKANCGKKETIKGVFSYALFKEVFRKALLLGAATRRSLLFSRSMV
jgi:hypothetical protein